MSFLTISKSVYDSALRERIISASVQQAWNNPEAHDTIFGEMVRKDGNESAAMIWPVCIATDVEQAYASALASNNPNPGGDESVITDGMILANVQYKWPQDPPPPPEPPVIEPT